MKPLEKALLLRKSARLRSKEPMRLFLNRLREPGRLLKLIEGQPLSAATKREARRQYLVCVCAAFETYWREFVRVNVDRHRIPASALEHLKRVSFTLADVHKVVGRKVSLGELVSCSFSFQCAEAVNVAVSEILQVKVFSEFAEARFSLREVRPKKSSRKRPPFKSEIAGRDILKSTCGAIDRCFAIRHDTVHSTGIVHRVAEREAVLVANAAWQFNTFVGTHVERRFSTLWGRR